MKIRDNKKCFYLLLAGVVFFLFGCRQQFTPLSDDKSADYVVYSDYDIRELEEQIPGYWDFYMNNQKKQEQINQKISNLELNWIIEGTYIIGNQLSADFYLCSRNETAGVTVERQWIDNRTKQDTYNSWNTNLLFYLDLADTDLLTLSGDAKLIPAADCPSLALGQDGCFYQGSYRVGTELPEGEYFMLAWPGSGGGVYDGQNQSLLHCNRFGYVTIEDIAVVNLVNCMLFDLDRKPVVQPITYQGTGDGAGQLVYSAGIYQVGVDLPIGTYRLKNELYPVVRDLEFKGYHGTGTYFPGWLNWCGLNAEQANNTEEQLKLLGWKSIELDSYVQARRRSIKIQPVKVTKNSGEYQVFTGLPTVTFSEKDIGCKIKVEKCILIPTMNQ